MMGKVKKRDLFVCVYLKHSSTHFENSLSQGCHRRASSGKMKNKQATTHYQYRTCTVQAEQTLKLCLNYGSTSVTITL